MKCVFVKTLILFSFLLTLPAMAQKHVFYLHGRIVENMGAAAFDSINGYGAYKYQDIVDSLKSHQFNVISEMRPKNTNATEYAKKVSAQINALLAKGVPPGDITVIGASKGAMIAMLVSSEMKNSGLNFVFMAGCSGDTGEGGPVFYGNILSIYEKSDAMGSCNPIRKNSPGINKYKEIELNTGLRHGFIFRPIPEWLNPAVQWANQQW